MGSAFPDESMGMGLGNQRVLAQIDKLRELNVGSMVPLPQLVVVGDQSSGKSSVLESLTGFSFPRATGLCTRYATQITCSRESHTSVAISIIPRPDADKETQQRLRDFYRCVEDIRTADFAAIFDKANRAMAIRPISTDKDDDDENNTEFATFSEDILKIEIKGPDQDHLTVIDVPGIFRTATPGQTTESDIQLVNNMVKNYMKDSRTIILAVIPCNVDIATQEILKLAKDADENGVRTMGVLTKPDLVVEQATQQAVLDLIQGKRNDLKLGYCVVKNRGADEDNASLAVRHRMEKAFFKNEPWSRVSSSGRVGIDSFKKRLSELLVDVSKREYPKVKAEIQKMLNGSRKSLEAMGVSRGDETSQRAFLGRMAAKFEKITGYALNAYYTEDPIFAQNSSMKLITRIIEQNELFAKTLRLRGHTHYFDEPAEKAVDESKKEIGEKGDFPFITVEIDDLALNDLHDIIVMDDYKCPEPSSNSIMNHIDTVFSDSRGPELGTFGGALLGTVFKEQSKKWEPLVLSHVSNAIRTVHSFICTLLDQICSEEDVRRELWDNVLLEKLQDAYKRAMKHAHFLLGIELDGKPLTVNHYFGTTLQKLRAARLKDALGVVAIDNSEGRWVNLNSLNNLTMNKGNPQQVREDLHDILKSYYKVSLKRFVDVICQQVIDHFLLNGKDSPLNIFSQALVLQLNPTQLEMIAGEEAATKQQRANLAREIENLGAAMKVLRG